MATSIVPTQIDSVRFARLLVMIGRRLSAEQMKSGINQSHVVHVRLEYIRK